mgnify:CR=1 FL=1
MIASTCSFFVKSRSLREGGMRCGCFDAREGGAGVSMCVRVTRCETWRRPLERSSPSDADGAAWSTHVCSALRERDRNLLPPPLVALLHRQTAPRDASVAELSPRDTCGGERGGPHVEARLDARGVHCRFISRDLLCTHRVPPAHVRRSTVPRMARSPNPPSFPAPSPSPSASVSRT